MEQQMRSSCRNTALWDMFTVRWVRLESRWCRKILIAQEHHIDGWNQTKTLDELRSEAAYMAHEKAKVSATGESFLLQSYRWPMIPDDNSRFLFPVAMWRFKAGESKGFLENHWSSSVGAVTAIVEAREAQLSATAAMLWNS